MEFYKNLKKLRQKSGLTQIETSKRIGIAKSTYSLYESGKREPDVKKIKKIAEIFGVSADDLLGTNFAKNKKSPAPEMQGLDEPEKDIIVGYRGLSYIGREAVKRFVQYQLAQEQEAAQRGDLPGVMNEARLAKLDSTLEEMLGAEMQDYESNNFATNNNVRPGKRAK
ncbi:MAG TPA: hypothetical protein DEA44_16885 [Firmicutes bacterium]|nr:hypothetical protein [Bacillota bacterium]